MSSPVRRKGKGLTVQSHTTWKERAMGVVVWCEAAVDDEVMRQVNGCPARVIKSGRHKWPVTLERLEGGSLASHPGVVWFASVAFNVEAAVHAAALLPVAV